jgi:prevent-host-death family protein
MYMSIPVVPLAEARRRLPELVRKVAGGHPPIPIGRRGRVEAVLVPPGHARAVVRRPLQGLVEVIGGPAALHAAEEEIRRQVKESLQRTAQLVVGEPPPLAYRRKAVKRPKRSG